MYQHLSQLLKLSCVHTLPLPSVNQYLTQVCSVRWALKMCVFYVYINLNV